MNEVTIGCIFLVLLLVLFLTGMELAFAMTIIGFLGFAVLRNVDAAVALLARDYFDVFSSYAFTVIPLFVLMGQAALNSGMAEKLYATTRKFVGHVPGGLALATIGGGTIFKAVSGSTLATAATFSAVAIPEMDRYGYSRKLSTGTVASIGTIGMLIPPAGNLIVYAMMTEQSIGKLFFAGLIPGTMVAILFLLVVVGWAMIDPKLAPRGPKSSWRERMRAMPLIIMPLIIFCVTIGGLMMGFFTPTEAGAVGSICVLALTIGKGDLKWKSFLKSVSESLRMACVVLMLVAGSNVLGHLVEMSKIPAVMADWALGLGLSPLLLVCLIIVIFLIGGSFMDDLAFMILSIPIFWPMVAKLGIDPIWFGIIIAVSLMIGMIIPPIAISVFIVKTITRESIWVVYAGVTPFLLALFVGLGLLFAFPGIATWLPNYLMK
jgi:C4-dicarboxylate transporter, DctM subunit